MCPHQGSGPCWLARLMLAVVTQKQTPVLLLIEAAPTQSQSSLCHASNPSSPQSADRG